MPAQSPVTHEALRKRAISWLTNMKRCGVVLSEISTCSEIPDAVGWQRWVSCSIECKTSRADWKRDGDKIHVRAERGVGQTRYYMVPRGLIQPEELDGSDYGLLWYSEESRVVKVMRGPVCREACYQDEISMLVSALRRVRAREFLILVPESPEEGK